MASSSIAVAPASFSCGSFLSWNSSSSHSHPPPPPPLQVLCVLCSAGECVPRTLHPRSQESPLHTPDGYTCPQCRAPKKRFAEYDVYSGKAIGGGLPPIGVIGGLLAGVVGVGALLVYGLQ